MDKTNQKTQYATTSIKIAPDKLEKFKAINQYFGVSNNSAINRLITEYILEHKAILDEIMKED